MNGRREGNRPKLIFWGAEYICRIVSRFFLLGSERENITHNRRKRKVEKYVLFYFFCLRFCFVFEKRRILKFGKIPLFIF